MKNPYKIADNNKIKLAFIIGNLIDLSTSFCNALLMLVAFAFACKSTLTKLVLKIEFPVFAV